LPSPRTRTEGFAPAKINLTLHVTGRRADGYHFLDSLVVFADVGDRITAVPAPGINLVIDGPIAAGLPADDTNLVLRAARLLAADGQGALITLTKTLPVASGIGGGSSDAAATLRVLARLWDVPLPGREDTARLGADVPVCLHPRPRRMSGAGEALGDVPPLPPFWLVLANPGMPVATAEVFRALTKHDDPPMPDRLPIWSDLAALVSFLGSMRNDLETPAMRLQPVIGEVLTALRATRGCMIARMSGSGATCFGIYGDQIAAANAAARIRAAEPGWWVSAGETYVRAGV
jgi:4-diphosphocytidyl-2-C-methyl-D-erythritol kinase